MRRLALASLVLWVLLALAAGIASAGEPAASDNDGLGRLKRALAETE